MLPSASASQSGPPAVLAFACGRCGTGLEVPAALAGVTGPCPVCGGQITAPSWTPAVVTHVAERPSELLTRPPRLREVPRPEPLLGTAPVRPAPLPPAEPPAAARPVRPQPAPVMEENTVAPVAVSVPAPRQIPAISPPAARKPQAPRGVFDASAMHHDDANEVVHRKPLTFRRRGLMRWVDVGIVSVFTGLCIACFAAFRYTVPVKDESLPGLPPNLNELVEKEARELKLQQSAEELAAMSSLERFLGCDTEKAAASHLLPPPDGLEMPALPAFRGIALADLAVDSSRRIPGTDRFIVMIKPPEAPGPVFVLQGTDRGHLLHSGVITQQTAGLFEKFIDATGTGSDTTLYAEVRPALPSVEREFRAENPNLAAYQLVDFRALGKSGTQLACIKVGGPAAQMLARHASYPGWRRCVATLHWAKDAGGADFVEIVRFQPGAWSGDFPEKNPQAALTAGANP